MELNLSRKTWAFLAVFAITAAACRAVIVGSDRNGIHSFGERVEGDRLLYFVKNPTGKAGFLSLTYQCPSTAVGPQITYAEVSVNGIFNETHAYVSSGGIGKKSIVIVLTMLHKKSNFSWEGSVWGF